MKVRAEDILKPGAVLEVKKIDFNGPDVKAFVAETKRLQKEILKHRIVTNETLRRQITI